MSPTLHTASLSPSEMSVVRQFDQYIRKTYGMPLAVYLLLELEEGRAFAIDRKSPEYKGMTRWQ